ncbi:MAG: YbaB/EbfC family nucleoid-associated protein [Dichotomicrobium sp.]
MKDFMNMMKQARELQSKMAEMQAEIEQLTRDGSAGAGLVTVTVNGKGEMRSVNVDPSLMKPDEKEILEDLIIAAHADAKAKMEEALQEKMKDITGGMPLPPGMKL